MPVPADYDGDQRADSMLYRPSTGQWWALNVRAPTTAKRGRRSMGNRRRRSQPADYDGDGRTDIAVWRASEARW